VTAKTGWSRPFEDPIPLPKGKTLRTLEDAAAYIMALPKKEADTAEWQAAMESLILVAELGGPTMFARIGVMRALNRGHVRTFDSTRKETQWGKRILVRDQ
jgi:NADPH-dependent 2,4-dienoyl-CoA reductase/sulfur reductase-like enzyme